MASPQRHINELPDSVLEDIFLHLFPYCFVFPYGDNNKTVEVILSSTCQRWRDLLSNSSKLWRRVHLIIPTDGLGHSDFSVLYQKAPAIRLLMIRGSVGTIFTRVFPNFPTFTKVESLGFNDTNLTPTEWALVVQLFPNVKKYNNKHRNRDLNDTTLQLFATGWPNLISIDVSNSHRLTGAGLIQFVTVANRLQSIDISGIPNLTDSDMDAITGLLGQSLKSIRFGFIQALLSGLAVRSIVQNCPQLEEIWILTENCNVGPLKHLANLRSLKITLERPANCEGLEEIFSRQLGQLRVLYIWNATNLTDSVLTQIANGCPLLDTLCLIMRNGYNNRLVTDLGLDQIVDKCRHLSQLEFFNFPLLTGRSFIGSREKLPKLKRLQLSYCPDVDEDAIRTEFEGVGGLHITVE